MMYNLIFPDSPRAENPFSWTLTHHRNMCVTVLCAGPPTEKELMNNKHKPEGTFLSQEAYLYSARCSLYGSKNSLLVICLVDPAPIYMYVLLENKSEYSLNHWASWSYL